MFASRVASYNDNRLVGTTKTTATDSFAPSHPLYREIATLARLRVANPALTRGRQVIRARGDAPGLFAVSRFDPATGREFVIAFNTTAKPIAQAVQVETASQRFTAMAGPCAPKAAAPGSLMFDLPAFGYAVCAAETR